MSKPMRDFYMTLDYSLYNYLLKSLLINAITNRTRKM